MAERSTRDNPLRALGIAVGVALVCALLVSLTAVQLRPRQVANLEAYRLARLESILSVLSDRGHAVTAGDIESRVVELVSGRYSDSLDAATFDARKAVNDPGASVTIPPALDVAGIKRRAQHATVFLVRDADGRIDLLILPVRGSGYQSPLYGYLALEGGLDRVLAFKIYEQGETAGLGSRVQEPAWEALWPGKPAFDASGRVAIHVGNQPGGDRTARVDAISGATLTSLGVNGMVRFWLGKHGFGPYLERIRQGEG